MKYAPAKLLLVLFLVFTVNAGRCQSNIWYFGDGAGLDFSSGTPVAITGGASYSLDNSTTASDASGNLLFYCNGESVWDATHNVMPNGDGLLGNLDGGQCALAVHQPGTQLYYLFTVDHWNGADGLRYSIIDMQLNSGLGDVTIKNQMLHTPGTERLEAVRNPIDGSVWLISHDWNNNQFRVFHITAAGLDLTPVISSVGAAHTGFNYNAAGQLTASPSGALLCCGIYDQGLFQVFDFDATTGVVSNPRDLPGYNNAWGCAFSPSNDRLYLTKWYDDEVIQVNLVAGSWANVQNSDVIVGYTDGNVSGWQAGFLQLGPDGKVYVAQFGENSIGAVMFPNVLGGNCDFNASAVSLGTGICKAGLCRTPLVDEPQCTLDVGMPMLTGCAWRPLSFTAAVFSGSPDAWQWQFGDGGSSTDPFTTVHTYTTEGMYVAQVIASEGGSVCTDTVQFTVIINAPETAGEDTSLVLCTTDPPVNLTDLLSPGSDMNGAFYTSSWQPADVVFDPSSGSTATLYYVIIGVHCAPDTALVQIAVQVCNGFEEITGAHFTISPNPADEFVDLRNAGGGSLGEVMITDAMGRVVRSMRFERIELLRVNVLDLADGIYTISTVGANRGTAHQLIIHHR